MVARLISAAAICAVCAASAPSLVRAQSVIAQPYNGQLRTDSDVGNVQGIQRYGRQMRTDPDVGEGYSYHVYPVAEYPLANTSVAQSGGAARDSHQLQNLQLKVHDAEQALRSAIESEDACEKDRATDDLRIAKIDYLWEASQNQPLSGGAGFIAAQNYVPSAQQYANPYPPMFDSTAGLRNEPAAVFSTTSSPFQGIQTEFQAATQALQALTNTRTSTATGGVSYTEQQIYHQPLIQIRARVVEIGRNDSLNVSSVLDYISREGGETLIDGNNVNKDTANLSGGSRFDQAGLIDFDTMKAEAQGLSALMPGGALVNLTTEHINGIIRVLATELNADIVTAPEVVTLNGQNVEFVAGEKVPFELGQNVIGDGNNNIQQFFYKHVGTYISVTPRIVDFGLHGEGQGNAAIAAAEVSDWNMLVDWMFCKNIITNDNSVVYQLIPSSDNNEDPKQVELFDLKDYCGDAQPKLPIPIKVKTELLKRLNVYTREQIAGMLGDDDLWPFREFEYDGCDACKWRPESCTIDLSVVIRLSDTGSIMFNAESPDAAFTTSMEKDVRAVANVVQVKSGHGVVMAGLIGEREVEDLAKIPVLGDIPYLGFLFRSKGTSRQKSEIVIFLEAEVLDPRPEVARAESARDFRLAADFLDGDLLDNPLECGMYRVGFGTYLPPTNCSECVYWRRLDRKVRKVCTHVDDVTE